MLQDGNTLLDRFVAQSPAMAEVLRGVDCYARARTPLVLVGATGSGKTTLAELIHALSGRSGVICARTASELDQSLEESKLFGHDRGAFTGAVERHLGILEEAGDGTLLLDDFHYLRPSTQTLLLRVLDRGAFRRLGGSPRIQRAGCYIETSWSAPTVSLPCPTATRASSWCATVLLVVTLTCCHEVAAILSLQNGLSARFPSENLGVALSPPSTLTVEFHNHPASEQERKQLALQVAEFVRDHYAEYTRLETVNISFDSVANTGPFSVVSSKIVYRFARRSLGEPSQSLPRS